MQTIYNYFSSWSGKCDIPFYISPHIPPTTKTQLHKHPYWEIGCCLSGQGWFYFGDKKYQASPGDLFIVNHLQPHIAESDSTDPSKYLFMFFDATMLGVRYPSLLRPFLYREDEFENRIPADLEAAKDIRQLLVQMNEEFSAGREEHWALCEALIVQIAVLLYRYYASNKEWAGTSSAQSLTNTRMAIHYIRTHFKEPLEFQDVANFVNLSESRLRAIISQTLGFSYKEYVLQLRIHEAKRLLHTTDMPLFSICESSGFQSLASFHREFKKATGTTPAQFRSSTPNTIVIETNTVDYN